MFSLIFSSGGQRRNRVSRVPSIFLPITRYYCIWIEFFQKYSNNDKKLFPCRLNFIMPFCYKKALFNQLCFEEMYCFYEIHIYIHIYNYIWHIQTYTRYTFPLTILYLNREKKLWKLPAAGWGLLIRKTLNEWNDIRCFLNEY